MRLIDADALLNRMQEDPLFDLVERYGVSGVINAEPTVDAVPVRHGKWTPHEEMSDEWNCSETWYRCQCGYDTRRRTPYCPMCGARMDIDETD